MSVAEAQHVHARRAVGRAQRDLGRLPLLDAARLGVATGTYRSMYIHTSVSIFMYP